MAKPDNSFVQYSPYIRLTKDQSNNYTLWIVTYIPQNFTIPEEPTIDSSNPEVIQVSVSVESNGESSSVKWEAQSLKVTLPTPSNLEGSVKTTIYLDDPENEGSIIIKLDEAEEE